MALSARVICLGNAFAAWTEKPVSAPDHISQSEAENTAKDVLKNGETL
ncbi:hypothetical protein [Phascolarctobacterium faecium]